MDEGRPPEKEISRQPAIRRRGAPSFRDRYARIAPPRGAFIMILAAAAIIASAFLNWVQGSTGWNLVYRSFGTSGNILFTWWTKGLLFSGLFCLLLGALLVAAAIILLARRRGNRLALAAAAAGLLLAAVNIVVIYANTLYFPAGPGLGLWMFAGVSLLTLLLVLAVAPAGAHHGESKATAA